MSEGQERFKAQMGEQIAKLEEVKRIVAENPVQMSIADGQRMVKLLGEVSDTTRKCAVLLTHIMPLAVRKVGEN